MMNIFKSSAVKNIMPLASLAAITLQVARKIVSPCDRAFSVNEISEKLISDLKLETCGKTSMHLSI